MGGPRAAGQAYARLKRHEDAARAMGMAVEFYRCAINPDRWADATVATCYASQRYVWESLLGIESSTPHCR